MMSNRKSSLEDLQALFALAHAMLEIQRQPPCLPSGVIASSIIPAPSRPVSGLACERVGKP